MNLHNLEPSSLTIKYAPPYIRNREGAVKHKEPKSFADAPHRPQFSLALHLVQVICADRYNLPLGSSELQARSIRIARKSFTLVWVGPLTISSPSFRK